MARILKPQRFTREVFGFVLECVFDEKGRTKEELEGYIARLRKPRPSMELDEFSRQTELEDWSFQQKMCNQRIGYSFTGNHEADTTMRQWITCARFYFPHQLSVFKNKFDRITQERLEGWRQFLQEIVNSFKGMKDWPGEPACKARGSDMLENVVPAPMEDVKVILALETAVRKSTPAEVDDWIKIANASAKPAPSPTRYRISKLKSVPDDKLVTVKNLHAFLLELSRDTWSLEKKKKKKAIDAILGHPDIAAIPEFKAAVDEARLTGALSSATSSRYATPRSEYKGEYATSAPAAPPGGGSGGLGEEKWTGGSELKEAKYDWPVWDEEDDAKMKALLHPDAHYFLTETEVRNSMREAILKIPSDSPKYEAGQLMLSNYYKLAELASKITNELVEYVPAAKDLLTQQAEPLVIAIHQIPKSLVLEKQMDRADAIAWAFRSLEKQIAAMKTAQYLAKKTSDAIPKDELIDEFAIKWLANHNGMPALISKFPNFVRLHTGEEHVTFEPEAFKAYMQTADVFLKAFRSMVHLALNMYTSRITGIRAKAKELFEDTARFMAESPMEPAKYLSSLDRLKRLVLPVIGPKPIRRPGFGVSELKLPPDSDFAERKMFSDFAGFGGTADIAIEMTKGSSAEPELIEQYIEQVRKLKALAGQLSDGAKVTGGGRYSADDVRGVFADVVGTVQSYKISDEIVKNLESFFLQLQSMVVPLSMVEDGEERKIGGKLVLKLKPDEYSKAVAGLPVVDSGVFMPFMVEPATYDRAGVDLGDIPMAPDL